MSAHSMLLGILVSSSLFISASGYLPQSQIDALKIIYNSTDGEHWTKCKWNITEFESKGLLSNASICGLTIEITRESEVTVTALDFTDNNLNGILPDSVFEKLPDLEVLGLPHEPHLSLTFLNFCSLKKLRYINIGGNLSGTVPHCIGNMSAMKVFAVGCMEDYCPLVFNDSTIEMWCENGNDITGLLFCGIDYRGAIPECIGNEFKNLEYLEFVTLPNLKSNIPESLNNLTKIKYLRFYNVPNLYGSFPSDIFSNNNNLEKVDIVNTSLSGTFNLSGLCEASSLSNLKIGNNQFEEWNLPQCDFNLEGLVLFDQQLTGTIPSGFCGSDLYFLQIKNTSLKGSIPYCLGNASSSSYIEITSNPLLGGTLPGIRSNNIEILLLNDNGFEGSISSILSLDKYPSLRVVAFHSNQFYDVDVGPLLHKLFEHSPNLQALTLYDNAKIAGAFPTFQHSVHLPLLQILAIQQLDLSGFLPNNLYLDENGSISSHSIFLFDNRLSGEIPKDFVPVSVDNDVLILQGNHFGITKDYTQPNWRDDAKFIGVSSLYLDQMDYIKKWGLLSLSALCLLYLIFKYFYVIPFMRHSDVHFIESIKFIEGHLADYKLLTLICVLLGFYPFFASYYAVIPVLDHFSLFYFQTTSIGWTTALALLFVIYNMIVINITVNICILGTAMPSEQDVVQIGYRNVVDEDETTMVVFAKFTIYTLLFLVNICFLICYIVSHQLPDDNVLGIGRLAREISTECISVIIAVNSSLIIPKFSHYFLRLFRCSVKKNVNKCVLVIRTITTVIIPITFSFILLNDCGSGWVSMWESCADRNSFDVVVPLESEFENEYDTGVTYTIPVSVDLAVLHHGDVCSPSFRNLDWNKCIRSFLAEWCNVLMVKMVIMMVMPIGVIIKKTLWDRKLRGKDSKIVIDSEYTMITTKLEMIFVFGIFCPVLYPLIICSLNSCILFYHFAAKTLGWNIVFKHYDDGIRTFPFHFLIFGILCEQFLTILFLKSSDELEGWSGANEILTWTVMACYIVSDIYGIYIYRKRKMPSPKRKNAMDIPLLSLVAGGAESQETNIRSLTSLQ